MPKFPELKNKNVIITGGSGFFGKQIVKAFQNQKSNVFVIDIRNNPTKNLKKNIHYFKADITKEDSLIKILDYFKKKKIKIDILINNAANDYVPKNKKKNNFKFENFIKNVWDNDLNVGLTGSFLTTKIFGTYMAQNISGVILNISSDLGLIAPDQRIYDNFTKPVTYSVIKHGIIGLTKYTAAYWSKKNIRCNAIAPGGIFNNQNKKFISKLNKLIPMGRMAKKNEYNDLVLFLCSPSSSYITGSVVVADGGRTII